MGPNEFPLYGCPCAVCGHPARSFVPTVGIRHSDGWCLFRAPEPDGAPGHTAIREHRL